MQQISLHSAVYRSGCQRDTDDELFLAFFVAKFVLIFEAVDHIFCDSHGIYDCSGVPLFVWSWLVEEERWERELEAR